MRPTQEEAGCRHQESAGTDEVPPEFKAFLDFAVERGAGRRPGDRCPKRPHRGLGPDEVPVRVRGLRQEVDLPAPHARAG